MTNDIHNATEQSPFEGASTHSLSNRLKRVLFGAVWFFLARFTPPPFHKWRIFLLRLFGAQVPYSAHVYSSVRIWLPSNLKMADQSSIGPRSNIYCMALISIGERAVISQGSHLCAGTHDFNDPSFQLFTRPILIEAHAWVCAEAFVGPGVTVGEGAVLGARAVAMASLEPWSVYAGNPAAKVKDRVRVIEASS